MPRTAPPAGTTQGRSQGRSPGRSLAGPLVLLSVLLVIAAGVWGVRFGLDAPHDGGPAWSAVPGGHLRVGEVDAAEADHSMMKGMGAMVDADEVPAGHRRIAVPVSLSADEGAITWRSDDFVVTTPEGARVAAYRAELGDGHIPEATQVSGTVLFDVPEESTGFTLSFLGANPVDLDSAPGVVVTSEPSPSSGSGSGHGGHGR